MKKINIDVVYNTLKTQFENYPSPVVELIEIQTRDPFKVLVTTILSARTKDQTTKDVAKRLFKTIDKADDFDNFSVEEIEKLIYPAGFYRNKAKALKKLPQVLNEKFAGNIPDTIDELIQLPGVGRKTANLVRAIAFKKPAICVDIHVHRISNRLGYVKTKTPFETEMALREILPFDYWITFNSYLVAYGQNHCSPRNPHCDTCVIYSECNRVGVTTKYPKSKDV